VYVGVVVRSQLAFLQNAVLAGLQTVAEHRLPRAVLSAIALRRLREMVGHAASHCPYYGETYARAGVIADDIRSINDLARLPAIDKRVLQAHGPRLLSSDAGPVERLAKRSSSGSSGQPSATYFDPIREVKRRTQEIRLMAAYGIPPWCTQVILDNPDHLAAQKPMVQKLGLWRRSAFPFDLGKQEALRYLDEHKPDVIHGVLAPLRLLAHNIRSTGHQLGYTPRLVLSKGELLDASTRKLIEDAFGAPLRDYYATEEVGIIAWEDPDKPIYNVDEDFVFVECIRSDGTPTADGEVGELVLTNLYHRAMPIIRFRTGDMGVLHRHPESSRFGLPQLESLRGRRMDCIVTADRRILSAFVLISVLEEISGVLTFRIIQTGEESVRIHVAVQSSGAEQATLLEHIRREITTALGPGTSLELLVEEGDTILVPKKSPIVKGIPGLVDRKLAEGYTVVM
jgi:phenylacetate-CoA ligase